LRPIRSPHEPVETCQLQHEAHQAYPAGTDLHTDQMERQDQAMQESQAGDAMKKRHDCGTLIKGLLVRLPGLQGTAGYVKHLGRLALGHTLGFEIAIAVTLLRAFEAI